MSRTPLVSCLMPAYNAASTLPAAIRSVLEQTLGDLELIVVDDGSTDETPEVLEALTDARVLRLRQPRAGPSVARNRALAAARGTWVACIDADDVWLPQKLAWQTSAMARDPAAAVAYGWTDLVDGELRPLAGDGRVRFEGEVLVELLRQNFICCGSNTLLRRAALVETGGFDESLEAAEDWELHVRLAARYRFVCVPEVVVWYRRTATSLSTDTQLVERAFLAARRKVFADVPKPLHVLQAPATGSFYRYLCRHAWRSDSWTSVPRYAALALWHDPLWFRRRTWPGPE